MKTIVPIFQGRVLPGGLLVLDRPKEYARYLRSAMKGRFIELIVRKQRVQRSLNQNAYWHAIAFPLLQEALGYDSIEELKLALLGECFGYHVDKLSGRQLPIELHTSGLDVDKGIHFTDWMIRFGAMLPSPCLIPLPSEAEAA